MNELAIIPQETLSDLAEKAQSSSASFSLATTQPGNFVAALAVADGIQHLRNLLDKPVVKQRILALQDTALGFRTDKDPKVRNWKTKEYNQPYDWAVVRDATIEAVLRGLQLVGNQWNIMSGRFYCTKEGFEFLIQNVPGLTAFKPVVGIPANKTGGAICECKATWTIRGVSDSLEVSIPVKTDDYSTADQIIGKATRKLLSRCYKVITGVNIPEGDAGEHERAMPGRPEIRQVPADSAAASIPHVMPVMAGAVPMATVTPTPAEPEPAQGSAPVADPAPSIDALRAEVVAAFKRLSVSWPQVQAAAVAGEWWEGAATIEFKDLGVEPLEYMLKRADRIARRIKAIEAQPADPAVTPAPTA